MKKWRHNLRRRLWKADPLGRPDWAGDLRLLISVWVVEFRSAINHTVSPPMLIFGWKLSNWHKSIFKEASYSKVPEVISLPFSGFPILAFMRISFLNFRGSLTSRGSVSRFFNFPYLPLLQMNPRKLSSWDQFLPIWDRLRSGMLRSHKIYCTLSP